MRIAYIVSGFPTFSETFVLREAVEIKGLGHDVQVYSLENWVDPCYYSPAEGIVRSTEYSPFFLSRRLLWANARTALCRPVKYWGTLLFALLHGLRTPIECLKSLIAYPKTIYYGTLIAARGVEHIHAHFANIPTLSALIIKRIWGIPYSFTAHAHDLYLYRSMLAEKLAGAAFAVTNSQFNREFLGRFCAPKDMAKVTILHCGGDVERLSGLVRRPEPGLVVSVSRLSEQKGYVYLVDACAILRQRGVPVRCLVAGLGPERAMLEARARELGVEEIFELPGRVPDVADLLARGQVFVLPCVEAADGQMDGIPTVLIEAMAAGIPVVSTTISGLPELVQDGEGGLLVAPEDPRALADAIERMLKDDDLARRLAASAREFAYEHYDLRKNARALADLFRRYGGSPARAETGVS